VLQDWLAFTSLEAESAECVALGAAGGALATLRTRDGPLARVNPVFLGGGGEADRASFRVTLSDIDHAGIFDAAALACELEVHVALFGALGGRASLPLRYEIAHDESALSPSVSGKDILSHSRVTSVGASGAIVEVDNKVLRAVTKNATDTLRPLLDSVEFLDVHVPSLVPKAAVEGHYNGSHYGLDLGMDMEDFVFDVLCALDEERDCKTELVLSFDCSAMTGSAGGQPCSALGRDVMAHVGGLIFPGSKKSTGVPSIAAAEAPADLGKSVEEPFDVVPGSAIVEAAGYGRDLLVFYEALDAVADIKLECTNVLCNFANRFAQTNINVRYHNASNSLLPGGGPSQVPTITINAHIGTAIDVTWSAAVEDGVGEVREGVGRLRKVDETAFELVWREQETFELKIFLNTPEDLMRTPLWTLVCALPKM